MSERARIIRPGDPSYEAHVALDRRLERITHKYGHTPGGQYHASVVARIQRELAERETAESVAGTTEAAD